MSRANLTWAGMEVPAPNRRAVLTHAVMEVPAASGAVSVDLVAARSESSAGSLSVGAPPAAPTGASATTQSATEILVAWTAPDDASLDVRVYRRKQGETDWVFVAQAPSTDLDYLDIELEAATTYEYHLTAWDGAQESDPSSTVSDTTTGGTALVEARSESSAGVLSVQTEAASTSLVSATSDSRAATLSVSADGSPVSVDFVAASSDSRSGVLSVTAEGGPVAVDLVAARSESRAGVLSGADVPGPEVVGSDELVFVVEIEAYDPVTATETTLRYGTRHVIADDPIRDFQPLLTQPGALREDLFRNGTTVGEASVDFGDLVVRNEDGDLDEVVEFALDGREVRIYWGTETGTFPDDYTQFIRATIEQAVVGVRDVTFKLRSRQAISDAQLQDNLYEGSNVGGTGLEGTPADLQGQPKPLTFGRVLNVQPPQVSSALLIYQVHDGAIESIDAVYDRGAELTDGGTYATEAELLDPGEAPALGEFKTFLPGGYVRLGAIPAGVITADVTEGAAADRTAAEVFRRILERIDVDAADISSADLAILDAEAPYEVGYWTGQGEVVATDALTRVAESVGAWWGTDRQGVFRIQRISSLLAEDALRDVSVHDMVQAPVRLATQDPGRGLPRHRITVRCQRNWHRQDSDLADGVSESRRAFLREGWRQRSSENAALRDLHPLATERVDDSLLADPSDAATEADARMDLYGTRRSRIEVVLDMTSAWLDVEIGTVLALDHPRLGLSRVVGLSGADPEFVDLIPPGEPVGSPEFTLVEGPSGDIQMATAEAPEFFIRYTWEGDMRLSDRGALPFLVTGVDPDVARRRLRLQLWG